MKSNQEDIYSDFDIELDNTAAKTEKVNQPGTYQIKKETVSFVFIPDKCR